MFLVRSPYVFQKHSPSQQTQKQMCYNKKESLFFDVVKMAKFYFQKFFIFNMITDIFSVEKWRTLEVSKR